MDMNRSNINNLTNLWVTGGISGGYFFTNEEYSVSLVHGADWPNKLWFGRAPDKRMMDSITRKWDLQNVSIVVWGDELPATEALLNEYGFTSKVALTGMSMRLDNVPDPLGKLRIEKVDDNEKAGEGSALFQKAFGYCIHAATVQQTMNKIDYFIGRVDGNAVGTAALFIDNAGIAGIHSMGVVPGYRRMGYAEELLLHTLNTARLRGAKYATLQASAMGEGLYLKTGFREDFKLKNFVKK